MSTKPPSPASKAPVTVSPLFKLFIGINIALCLVCLGVMVWLTATADDKGPKMRESLYATCETVFKMTAGAFLGLLAGKGSSPDRTNVG